MVLKDSQQPASRLNRPAIPKSRLSSSWKSRLNKPEIIAPIIVGLCMLTLWESLVRLFEVPPYLLPGPLLVFQTLVTEWPELFPSLLITLQITVAAFLIAIASGLLIAVIFTQSKWIERSFFPYAVILQTTPIVAIAPLIIIWFKNSTFAALVVCAWIVALFPIVSNTTLGLNSADHNLTNLFRLYGASRWQTLWHLRLPSAMPYFLGGLRISGGLALIGAVVAEFVAGTGGARSGIAYQILMSSYRLQIPRMFAALIMTTLLGVLIFVGLTVLSDRLLSHWHESAIRREN
ncbi:ABC transporter permease [Oscillatoria sp. CS-180]|uniref:ABC transporter permease n=1 Tax=Oscillatoria sp. CS-180 TaxID=3021720 RepID=UPI00232DF138|nr:ABC transporter permease [Oscillatoria sp. CS-180]MDB9527365.1 ABC transporter permease [Oscillatoria sp. CS-180]